MQNSHTGNYKYKVCILGYSYMFQLAHKVVSTLLHQMWSTLS